MRSVAVVVACVAVVVACVALTGCGHQLTGTTYRAQVGRSVTEMFHDGTTTWQVGAEMRFDVPRR